MGIRILNIDERERDRGTERQNTIECHQNLVSASLFNAVHYSSHMVKIDSY